jgi:hypothetical protein
MNTVSRTIILFFLVLMGCNEKLQVIDKPNLSTNKPNFFTLSGGSYPFIIEVVITPDARIAASYIREILKDKTINTSTFKGRSGITFDFRNEKPCVIWLKSATFDPESMSIVNHELLHATINIMRYSGVSFSDSSEEAYTYELQYLTNQFYNKLK